MSDYREEPLPPARHERTDVSAHAVGLGLGAWLVVVVLLIGLCTWLFPQARRDERRILPVPGYPAPKLQAAPPVDLSIFLDEQRKQMNGVYWIDRKAGLVHMPIEDAMRRVAERGIPDWPDHPPTEVQR